MNKYNVGDVVKFTDTNGGYYGINNYGKIVSINGSGYDVECAYTNEKVENDILFFFEDEIAGVKEN